jgi:hypothetical protein
MDEVDVLAAIDIGRSAALRGDWLTAANAYRVARKVRPSDAVIRHALALSLLGAGDYAGGLPLYAHRGSVRELSIPRPRLDAPEWQGEGLSGRHIVLFHEQGFGDEIMFARFAPILREMGAEVTLFCSPPLVRLFQQLGVRVIGAAGAVEFPDPDCWALIGDLPLRLGIRPETIPGEPYLSAVRGSVGGIGLVRRGNPRHPNDQHRSMPDEIVIPFPHRLLHPEVTGATHFLETAQIISGLDAVVTVDTSVAHLAGAMGKTAFLLLPAIGCDWRWMSDPSRTPWYPSVTLIRQERSGDWVDSLQRLAALL